MLEIQSKIFNLVELQGLRREGGNPYRFVRKYKVQQPERLLSEEEFLALGEVLNGMEAEGSVSAYAAGAIRLLILTGCRRNEIVVLRWEDVDLEAKEPRLQDGKTGARLVHLTPATAAVPTGPPRVVGNPWVIAGSKPGRNLADLQPAWEAGWAKRAGLEGVRIHDLCHGFAPRTLPLAEGFPMVGTLSGHTQVQTALATLIWRASRSKRPHRGLLTALARTSSRRMRQLMHPEVTTAH